MDLCDSIRAIKKFGKAIGGLIVAIGKDITFNFPKINLTEEDKKKLAQMQENLQRNMKIDWGPQMSKYPFYYVQDPPPCTEQSTVNIPYYYESTPVKDPPKMEIRAIFVGGPKDGEGLIVDKPRDHFEVAISPPVPLETREYLEILPHEYFVYKAFFIGGTHDHPELIVYYDDTTFRTVSQLIAHLVLNYIGK